jgi:hypothetical protein
VRDAAARSEAADFAVPVALAVSAGRPVAGLAAACSGSVVAVGPSVPVACSGSAVAVEPSAAGCSDSVAAVGPSVPVACSDSVVAVEPSVPVACSGSVVAEPSAPAGCSDSVAAVGPSVPVACSGSAVALSLLLLLLVLVLLLLLLPLILVLLLTFVLLLVLVLLPCVDRSSGSDKQEQNSCTYEFDLSHWSLSFKPCFVLNTSPKCSCKYHSLDFRLFRPRSAQPAKQVNDQHDYKDGPDYSQAPAGSPSGISVITAATAKQKHQKNE